MLTGLFELLGRVFGELFFLWLERRSPWLFWPLVLGLLGVLGAIVYFSR